MTENRHLFAVPSLVAQKKHNSDNCIVLVIINFLMSAWSLEVLPVVKPTQNFGGGKCLTLGKQQHFCLGHRFSKHKMTRYAKIWGVWPPGLPLATPMGPALLAFHENFAHSAIFYIVSRIHVYFTKSGISNTTRA